jgi:exopolysaccharide production protein ExoZ
LRFEGGSVMGNGAPGRKVLGLQLLRAVAAMMVAYSHLMERVVLRGFVDPAAWWLNIAVGRFGVCVFFAISGFVMIHANGAQFGADGYRTKLGVFFKRRLARIYPLYVVATLAYMAFVWATKHEAYPAIALVKSLLFIPYLNNLHLYQPVYGLGWSLNYEVFFYCVVGAALVLPMRQAVCTICLVIVALVLLGLPLEPDQVRYHGADLAWYFTRPVMLYFVAGVLARAIPPQGFERGIANPVAIAVALVAMGLAYWTGASEWIAAPFMFVLIRAVSHHVTYDGLWPPGERAVEFLGDSSYSLYLTHSFVLGGITIGVARLVHAPVAAMLACLALGLVATVATAALAYLYIERPLVRWATRWLLP